MIIKLLRGALGGAAGFVIAMLLANAIFFQLGQPVLFENSLQSDKLLAALFEDEPLPLMFEDGLAFLAFGAVVGVVHGLVFFWIEPGLPRTRFWRGASFAVILWALMALFFEFHAPFNILREPLELALVKLAFWAPVLLVEGLVISFVYGPSQADKLLGSP